MAKDPGSTHDDIAAGVPAPQPIESGAAIMAWINRSPIDERLVELLDKKVMYTDPDTGAQKEKGLVRSDLIPPRVLIEEGAVYGFGASKYDDWNWAKGYPWSLSLAAMHRHLLRFEAGEDLDPESGLHHLAHVRWHAATLMEFGYTNPDHDDRYRP